MLIPSGRGSFGVIVGMGWLSKNKVMIVCHEKEVRISLEGYEILRVQDLSMTTATTSGVPHRFSSWSDVSREVSISYSTLGNARITLTTLRVARQSEELGSVKDKILATLSETHKVENAPAEMLRDMNQQMEKRADDGKANVVTGALSRKERVKPRCVRAMAMTIQYGVRGMILAAQSEAFKQENVLAERLHGLDQQMERKGDGSLYFKDRIWVPLVGGVRTVIMDEAHKSRYSVHPGADKMYYDLRDMYWWSGIKRDIATYVSECLTCAKVKAEHQRPLGLLQQPEIPEWKWENITMDFITKLPRTRSRHDAIWVVVDRLTKSTHFLAIRKDYSTKKLARLLIEQF
ncbi:putative reverse transcriptase domain-containing protein, partial [Tanacetum coccineum]